jgi:acyl-CoA oxidase
LLIYEPGLSLDDIVDLSPRFWKLWLDPRLTRDSAAMTLFTIQYNLVLGTLGMLGSGREDLSVLIQDLLEYKMLFVFFRIFLAFY